jgi:ABC-type Zn uptake system ZnuABC Zn-binding protein ZnuA
MFSQYHDNVHDSPHEPNNSKEKAMIGPEQEILIQLIKEAITFIAEELKQFWRSSREKSKNNKELAIDATERIGLSQELEETLMQQVKNWHDQTELELLKRDLETSLNNAKQYHIRWSLLKKKLPLAGPTEATTIEMNMEEAQSKEKEASEEIKMVIEKLANRKIIVD